MRVGVSSCEWSRKIKLLKKKKERNSKKTFNVTRAAYKIYRTVENSEDSVLLFPLFYWRTFTPARILVVKEAGRTFMCVSTRAVTIYRIPDFIWVLNTFCSIVRVAAHAST